MKKLLTTFVAGFLPAFILMLSIQSSQANSATWKANPISGDWNTAANWTPNTVPNGPADTATFRISNRTAVSLSANTEVNGIVFNAGASAFMITASTPSQLIISDVGITNNSGISQNFMIDVGNSSNGQIVFTNSATAGTLTVFTNGGATVTHPGGHIQFFNTSTAGSGSFTNNGSADSGAGGGLIEFFDGSTAGNGSFSNNGATVSDAGGGFISFYGSSIVGNGMFTNNPGAVGGANGGGIQFNQTTTAGDGTFTNKGGTVSGAKGGSIVFNNQSTAAQATLIAEGGVNGGEGGSIQLDSGSNGGTARVEVFGNGNLDISARNRPPVSVGSVEGNGNIFLGSHRLIVGTNNLDTIFSGLIQDGGIIGGAPGKLTKAGAGKLTLTKRNTYTGGTTINSGTFLVNNGHGSGTGSDDVLVNGGALGGTGKITGTVFVGLSTGPGAFLSPGRDESTLGTLTIRRAVSFRGSDAVYQFEVNSNTGDSDSVIANGVTINTGTQFNFSDLGNGTLSDGTVFIAINNTSANPISGTFNNLPDGATFMSSGNTYEASYEGGDGNDLTLTVVP